MKKYIKFNLTNVNIVICVGAIIISICTYDYFSMYGSYNIMRKYLKCNCDAVMPADVGFVYNPIKVYL